ncbi:MAG: hypothetical protein ACYDH9_07225 [Limisphaerales bacterium]
MLVVLASSHDASAREIVERWEPGSAALLSCEDLSTPGWRYFPRNLEGSQAVVGGQVIPLTNIDGVLTRRPAVLVPELLQIATADREYAAAEMNAFLIAFLSALPCRVLNRPTPDCLSGPNWRPEQWTHAATRLNIPASPAHRRVPFCPEDACESSREPFVEVIVVGERWFGPVDEPLGRQAQQLACAAGTQLLGVWFSGPRAGASFVGANLWPDLSRDEVSDAVRDYLLDQ